MDTTALAVLAAKLPEVTKKVDSFSLIASGEQETEAISYLATIKKIAKQVNNAKKEIEKPLKDELKAIKNQADIVLIPLAEAEATIKQAVTNWHNTTEYKEAERKREEAERARINALHDAKKHMDEDAFDAVNAAHNQLQQAQQDAPTTVNAKHGKAHFRTYTRFAIEDLSLVPEELKQEAFRIAIQKGILDSVIRKQIDKGIHDIPGVRTWTEDVPIIKTK